MVTKHVMFMVYYCTADSYGEHTPDAGKVMYVRSFRAHSVECSARDNFVVPGTEVFTRTATLPWKQACKNNRTTLSVMYHPSASDPAAHCFVEKGPSRFFSRFGVIFYFSRIILEGKSTDPPTLKMSGCFSSFGVI